ncbi:hypothetical protein ACS0TY_005736 [Phlomoides rotata]
MDVEILQKKIVHYGQIAFESFALECWEEAGFQNQLVALVPEIDSLPELFCRMILLLDNDNVGVFATISWRIWREMNNICWEGKRSKFAWSVIEAYGYLHEWKFGRGLTKERMAWRLQCEKWHLPATCKLKLDVDAAQFMEDMTTDDAEVFGLHEALSWSKSLGMDNIEVEMDANVVVDAMNNKEQSDSIFGCFVHSCKSLQNICEPHVRDESPTFVDDLLDSICYSCE